MAIAKEFSRDTQVNSMGIVSHKLSSKLLATHRMSYSQRDLRAVHSWERWGAGVETQKNVRGEIGGWGRVPFNEPYAPSLSTIYDGA